MPPSRRPGYRQRRMMMLMALTVPEFFMKCTGIRIQSSHVLIRSRLIPALMMMRNRDRRYLARCTWWPFHPLAAIEWGDPKFQAMCCRKLRTMVLQ